MEITILKEEKDTLELQLDGEGHTLCNLLRKELWDSEDTKVASYNISHPLIASPKLIVVSEKTKPRKLLLDSVESLKKKNSELRSLLKKL